MKAVPGQRRWLTLFLLPLLVLSLLLAQALGAMHGVVHAPQAATHLVAASLPDAAHHHGNGHRNAHDAADESRALHPEHGTGWLEDLFSLHDDGDAGCRLFDQASHTDTAPFASAALLPLAPAAGLLATPAGEVIARRAALFDARGPPLSLS